MFLPSITISSDIRYDGCGGRKRGAARVISVQFQPIMRTLHRRVLARITAASFADRETVKCRTARVVEIAMRIARRTKCGGMRESTVMRLVNRGSAHNRHYRLSPAIMSDDNARCGNLV